jgi:hypothetical protein
MTAMPALPSLDIQRVASSATRLLLAFCLLPAAGCEKGRTLGRVTGTVTLDGQACRDVMVVFASQKERAFITAAVDTEGAYVVQMAEGHGLPVGTYQVSIRQAPPDNWDRPQEAVPLPPKYRDPSTSGLTLEVAPGENQFDIPLTSSP